MPLFSIIVPVFNVEEYLEKSIDSILCQSFQDFEILLIDDGSPDRCGKICDSYAAKDGRVQTIHKTNGGLSSARNQGLDIAKGDYIMFVDSDDHFNTSNALEAIADRIRKKDEDIIVFGCKNQDVATGESYISRGSYNMGIIDKGDKNATLLYLYNSNNFPGSAWIMATRRKLIETIHLRFVEGETAEDYYWNANLLYHAKSIGAVDTPLYTYMTGRSNSITSSSTVAGIKGMMRAVKDWRNKTDRECMTGITRFLARTYAISLMSWNKLDKNDKEETLPLLQTNKDILKEAGLTSYKILYHTLSIFGTALPAKLVECLYRVISRRKQ